MKDFPARDGAIRQINFLVFSIVFYPSHMTMQNWKVSKLHFLEDVNRIHLVCLIAPSVAGKSLILIGEVLIQSDLTSILLVM